MNLRNAIANRLNVKASDIYGKDLQLKDVLAMSPNCINSIDIMEAFVGAMADIDYDDEQKLPVFTLNSMFDGVVDELEKQISTGDRA